MVTWNLGPAVEHQAHEVLGPRLKAYEVAFEGERGGTPLDGLGHPSIGTQDDLPHAQHRVLERVLKAVEPGVDLWCLCSRSYFDPLFSSWRKLTEQTMGLLNCDATSDFVTKTSDLALVIVQRKTVVSATCSRRCKLK